MNPSKGRAVQKTTFLDISLTDGSRMQGKVFVPVQGRLIDVLNDERPFLPVETAEGDIVAIAKTSIKQMKIPGTDPSAYVGNDPYAILGLQPGVSLEELKKTYHELSMANHPDRIRSFGLGGDFMDLATKNMARINMAYTQILKNQN